MMILKLLVDNFSCFFQEKTGLARYALKKGDLLFVVQRTKDAFGVDEYFCLSSSGFLGYIDAELDEKVFLQIAEEVDSL